MNLVYLSVLIMSIACSFEASAVRKKKGKKNKQQKTEAVEASFQTCSASFGERLPGAKNGLLKSDSRSERARFFGDELNFENVVNHLRVLTGETTFADRRISDRYTQPNKDLARKYIGEHLVARGYLSKDEVFDHGWYGKAAVNVIGELKGTRFPEEVIEIVVHYDSTHEGAPGADDNGSGVALAMELATRFALLKPQRTIRFVFSDLEETGSQGVEHHVGILKKNSEPLFGAYVLDQIGYNPRDNMKLAVEVGSRNDFATTEALLRNQLFANHILYQFVRFTDRENIALQVDQRDAKPGTGDHGSYWSENYPAIFISAPYTGHYINPKNHSKEDTIVHLNLEYYEEVCRLIAEAIAYSARVTITEGFGAKYKNSLAYIKNLEDHEVLPQDNYLPPDPSFFEKKAIDRHEWAYEKLERESNTPSKNLDWEDEEEVSLIPFKQNNLSPLSTRDKIKMIENADYVAVLFSPERYSIILVEGDRRLPTLNCRDHERAELMSAAGKRSAILRQLSSEAIFANEEYRMLIQVGLLMRAGALLNHDYADYIIDSKIPPRFFLVGNEFAVLFHHDGRKIVRHEKHNLSRWDFAKLALDLGVNVQSVGYDFDQFDLVELEMKEQYEKKLLQKETWRSYFWGLGDLF